MRTNLPAQWRWARIGEHFKRVQRKNTAGVDRVLTASGTHGLVDQKEFFNRRVAASETNHYYHLKRGEFAYNRSAMNGYPFGAIKRLDAHDEGALSTLYICFSLRPEAEVDPDFAAFLFDSDQLDGEMSSICAVGARAHGLLNVTPADFFEVSIPVPPLREQRKIAAILSSVDDAIAATRQVIEQAKRVKKGLLQTLMTQGIGHTRFKKTEIGEIPEAWGVSPVGDQFHTRLGKMLNKKARNGPQQRPYVGNAQVQWTRVDFSDMATMHFDERDMERFSLRKGDLLVCEGGEIGRTALWMGEIEECYFQKAIHRLRPRNSYLPSFFLRYMMLAASSGRFSGYSAQTSISHLTQEKLRRMPIPVPPHAEQEEIAGVFDAVDEHIGEHEKTAGVMAKLKQGLMQDLLTGRVRVQLD